MLCIKKLSWEQKFTLTGEQFGSYSQVVNIAWFIVVIWHLEFTKALTEMIYEMTGYIAYGDEQSIMVSHCTVTVAKQA